MIHRFKYIRTIAMATGLAVCCHFPAHAEIIIDLGGPATGYLAVSNFKNSTTRNGIEGKDESGNPSPGHNGLPDYPNYQIPPGQLNAGVWTAIIASPQFAGADYSPMYAYGGLEPEDVTVHNRTITDPNYSTMSAGQISFASGILTGIGLETVGVSQLNFNFDTYAWDGKTGGDHGPWDVGNVPAPYNISPFSPIYTEYNDGTGAGNASLIYNISLSNVTGTGLTFQDGALLSMDIAADLAVLTRVGYIGFGEPNAFNSTTFTGNFSADGLDYAFDIDEIRSVALWSGMHMVMNRAGTASMATAVPEPGSIALLTIGAIGVARRRWRFRRTNLVTE